MRQVTRVKTVCADDFESVVVNNSDVRTCIVEVFKSDCPSCAFNGKVFNALSRKLEKHGYGSDLPLYRVGISNKLPFMGNFGYSPMYIFIRKDSDNKITEMFTLDPPQRANAFMDKVAELSELPGLKDKIKFSPRDQYLAYSQMRDLDPGFDIDFDLELLAKENQQQPK